ncbi:MAG: helix-turn-helix transcriptional regulator [Lentisphaeria bacterium]|nr:helix-turn-helix transcriptional regulator [Lentisphaeria bacterium]
MTKTAELDIPPVGKNLKKERLARHLSLGALSEASGISKAMLSQIESGRVNPTLVTLWKAAHALGVELAVLIDGKNKKPEHFTFIPGSRLMSIAYDEGKVIFKILTAPGIPDRLEMYHVSILPGARHHSEPHPSGCEEYVLVTRGQVRVTSGDNTAELGPGDFLAYQGDLPHSLENIGPETAELHMTDLATEA